MKRLKSQIRDLAVSRRLEGQARLVRASPHFDPDWYLRANPDVRQHDMDPARHYVEYGHDEGRPPGPGSSASDLPVARSALAAMRSKFRSAGSSYGPGSRAANAEDWAAVARASDYFDPDWYLRVYMDVRESGMDPVEHYVQFGWTENRNPGPNFNTSAYLDQMADLGHAGQFPLLHFEQTGRALGLNPKNSRAAVPVPFPVGPMLVPSSQFTGLRVGVVAHVFYPELATEVVEAVARVPVNVHVMVSTDTAEKAELLRTEFGSLRNSVTLDIRVVPNRGRDVAPMLVQFADAILACDLVLHLHTKKSPYGSHLQGWRQHSFSHLVHSELFVDMVLRAFEEDPHLGVACPPPFPGAVPFMTWAGMRESGAGIFRRCGLDPEVLNAFPLEFPAGSMMWFRPDALRQVFEAEWDWADFPEELGQSDGTPAHVFERLIFYFARSNGYSWQAIRPAARYEGSQLRLLSPPRAPMELPVPSGRPLISVVVPIHNQWEMTATCLRALIEHTDPNQSPFEVILADDASVDETQNARAHFANVIVERGEQNVGFLQNVNRAAARARGDYILLLNNDTQVQPGALAAMRDGFARMPDAAAVGAKLLYPDGTLQEAGGIIWSDGSGANFGRGAIDALAAEFSYFKEVDYVSGAALMVDHEFWRMTGGFDPRFAPAYYEDTDFCFAARAAGRRVFMHPGALVAHFEGQSHGTDIGTGVKAYQSVNRETFVSKWSDTLRDCHPGGISRARERSEDRRIVAVIDWELPEFDRHAGGRYVWDYLNLMIDHGYVVKFLACHVGEARQLDLAAEMRRIGIETLLPADYLEETDWRDWLSAHADTLDAVILSRPRIADGHLAQCRASGLRSVFLCHDIHSLRARREADIKDDLHLMASATHLEDHERTIFDGADFVFTPSQEEKKLIERDFGVGHVGVLPLHIERSERKLPETAPAGRRLLFVGGMAHAPNPDAMLWFLEAIWPSVLEQVPDARFDIVGRAAPDHLLTRQDESVTFLGGVSDAQLAMLYESARVAVAPLRFGAGVKGKVLEAMAKGVPIVATTIALEGVNGLQDVVPSSDAPEDFASRIVQLLLDNDVWIEMARLQSEFIATEFGEESALRNLRAGLGF